MVVLIRNAYEVEEKNWDCVYQIMEGSIPKDANVIDQG